MGCTRARFTWGDRRSPLAAARLYAGGVNSDVVVLRHELHAHPDLSGLEHATAERIVQFLAGLGPDGLITGVGGTGVIATFTGTEPGPQLLFRCELDALPISEVGVEGHASTVTGVSHKCGHDGHMATLCGVAAELARARPPRGAVHLLFQPAEETGTGAAAVLADPAFDAIRPDAAVAIHNMPGFPAHAVVLKAGAVTPAVRGMVIRLYGRTAHASEPEKGVNPSLAVADLLRECASMCVNDAEAEDFALVTPVHVRIGTVAYGVSAGDAEVHLTLRTHTNDALAALHEEVLEVAADLASREGLTTQWHTVEDFYAVVNDAELTERVARAAENGGLNVLRAEVGIRAGEDFGLYSQRFPCCLVILGAGEGHPPLHSPDYDFPDELLVTGVDLLMAVIRDSIG